MELNKAIDKIEEALIRLSQNPSGSWTTMLKTSGVPYYGHITGWLTKNGYTKPEGNGLRWVGKEPTRATAAMLYEDALSEGRKKKSALRPSPGPVSQKQPSEKASPSPPVNGSNGNGELLKALALMEKAINAGIPDPVGFVQSCLQDPRI